MSFWLAWRFLTIIPVPGSTGDVSPKRAGTSLTYFPVVGAIIGLLLFGVSLGLGHFLSPLAVSALVVLALAVITGGNHLDGLADTCDGLVSGKSPEERLRLMHSSGIGAFGAVGVCLALLLKFALLVSVDGWEVLVLMATLSRWVVVGAIFIFPYARVSGLGTVFKSGVRWHHFAVATVIALAMSLLTFRLAGVVVMLVVCAVTYGVASLLRSKLGGLTGDTYGAIIELSEVTALVTVVLLQGLLGDQNDA